MGILSLRKHVRVSPEENNNNTIKGYSYQDASAGSGFTTKNNVEFVICNNFFTASREMKEFSFISRDIDDWEWSPQRQGD